MRPIACLAVATLTLAACRDARVEPLETRVAELSNDVGRLSRELEDLRRRGGAGGPAGAGAPVADEPVRRLEAKFAGVLEHLSGGAPIDAAALEGVWRRGGDGTEVLHLARDGRLCGFRIPAGATTKEPFWGTWERRGRFLIELHDRWTGARNDFDPVVREVAGVKPEALELKARKEQSFERVAPGEWEALGSQYDDRIVRMPGLPPWCLSATAR